MTYIDRMVCGIAEAMPFQNGVHCQNGALPKKLKGSLRRPFEFLIGWRLENLNALCLETLGSLNDAELDRLTFLQGAETARLDGGEMYEDIFAGLTGDETKTFSVVKPLHCTLFHFDIPRFRLLLIESA